MNITGMKKTFKSYGLPFVCICTIIAAAWIPREQRKLTLPEEKIATIYNTLVKAGNFIDNSDAPHSKTKQILSEIDNVTDMIKMETDVQWKPADSTQKKK